MKYKMNSNESTCTDTAVIGNGTTPTTRWIHLATEYSPPTTRLQ
jgi:hypothetical protein